jgi:hypothetical protein
VCPRQIAGGHEKFVHNLAACENKGFLEKFCPFILRQWMMRIQPAFEGTIFLLKDLDPFGVLNGGIDFEPVADDTRICQQAGAVVLRVIFDFVVVLTPIGFTEVFRLLQDRDP